MRVRQHSTPPAIAQLSLEMRAQPASLNFGNDERHAHLIQPTAARRVMWRSEDVFVLVSSLVCIRAWLLCITWLENGLWTLSLGFMGTICLMNASRCGRTHCYFTGPFLILGAVTSLGYGIGLLPFGPSGWKWIGDITIIGAIVLTCVPELFLGRYRRREANSV